jgi:hypothetical protein
MSILILKCNESMVFSQISPNLTNKFSTLYSHSSSIWIPSTFLHSLVISWWWPIWVETCCEWNNKNICLRNSNPSIFICTIAQCVPKWIAEWARSTFSIHHLLHLLLVAYNAHNIMLGSCCLCMTLLGMCPIQHQIISHFLKTVNCTTPCVQYGTPAYKVSGLVHLQLLLKKKRFKNWICFCPQVKGWGGTY